MGILDWIRRDKRLHEKHAEFEHATFGPLKFNSAFGWLGWPISDDCFGGHFSIIIEGDIDGPFAGANEAFTLLSRNWSSLCKPASFVLTQMLVRHFPDAPTPYFINGNLWSHTRLTSVQLSRDGGAKLWFQFKFQREWENRYVVVEIQTLTITKIDYESKGDAKTLIVQ